MRASNYAISKRDYYTDFVTVPFATTVAVLWLFTLHTVNPSVFTSSVVTGLLSWTFIEYALHRWGFHGKTFSAEHSRHHSDANDFIGFNPISTAAIGAFSFWGLTVLFGPVIGVGILVGLVVGYLAYISLHAKFHQGVVKSGTYLARLNANHDYHHKRFKVNYGVVTPAWDMIFGTYQRNPAKPDNEV